MVYENVFSAEKSAKNRCLFFARGRDIGLQTKFQFNHLGRAKANFKPGENVLTTLDEEKIHLQTCD